MTLRDFFNTFFLNTSSIPLCFSPQLQCVSTYAMQVPLIDGGAEVKSYQLYRDVGNPQFFFSVANDDDNDDG